MLLTDANTGTARVEALDVNDEAPVFVRSSLFAAVEEEAEFDTSVTQLMVSGGKIKFNLCQLSTVFRQLI